jgi:3-methyl-2-oxobutanoate hydroxymethyltransferase
VRNFMDGAGTNQQALTNYVKAIRDGSYPAPEHEF